LSHNMRWANCGSCPPYMPHILTSWKEIGQYLGKGVRTVQRWEREAGLPVRRQTEPSPHAVIAISDELDGWARSRTRGPGGAVAGALQREIALLHSENVDLRARLNVLETAVAAMSHGREESAGDEDHPEAGLTVAEETAPLQIGGGMVVTGGLPAGFGDLSDEGHEVRVAMQLYRGQSVRARIYFAFALCALVENPGHIDKSPTLRRVQNSMLSIRRSLEKPGYVPSNELADLRGLLTELASRIERVAQAPA
jgi:hypothetical protein